MEYAHVGDREVQATTEKNEGTRVTAIRFGLIWVV